LPSGKLAAMAERGLVLSNEEAQQLAYVIGTALRTVPAEQRQALLAPARDVLAALNDAAAEHRAAQLEDG
jgi:hypothetical protein